MTDEQKNDDRRKCIAWKPRCAEVGGCTFTNMDDECALSVPLNHEVFSQLSEVPRSAGVKDVFVCMLESDGAYTVATYGQGGLMQELGLCTPSVMAKHKEDDRLFTLPMNLGPSGACIEEGTVPILQDDGTIRCVAVDGKGAASQ